MFQTRSISKALDGPAVVSAIMAANDPYSAAAELRSLLGKVPDFAITKESGLRKVDALLKAIPSVIGAVSMRSSLP